MFYCQENRIEKPTAEDVKKFMREAETKRQKKGKHGCAIESNN